MAKQIRKKANKINPKSAMVRARTSPRLKLEAERVFSRLGISSTEAINLFYAQVCLRHGLPFAVEIPNEETIEVFKKTEKNEQIVHLDNIEELFVKLGIE